MSQLLESEVEQLNSSVITAGSQKLVVVEGDVGDATHVIESDFLLVKKKDEK